MHIFSDFKGFDEAKINLFNNFTILIGPNGSGKSNVIEGIELLAFVAQGRPLHEIADVGKSGGRTLEIRGGLKSCPSFGDNFFALEFDASIQFLGKQRPMSYFVGIDPEAARIFYESLKVGDYKIFEVVSKGKDMAATSDVAVEYNNFAPGGNNPRVSVSANCSVISQYTKFAIKNKKIDACSSLVSSISNYLKYSFIFDPVPKEMRSYERIGDNRLSRNGSNLSSVLFALKNGNETQKESLNRMLSIVRQLPDEPYNSFEFIATQLNDVIFAFKQGDNNNLVDARLLSDGTLRFLAVLAAVETVEEGSRVIIEEFDNGLHPSRAELLSKAIFECCERRKLNVLLTTHNPATLNVLNEKQLNGVVFCFRDINSKSAKLIYLKDLPCNYKLLESGRLGDLITLKTVEKYFSSDFCDEQSKKSLEWLRGLS